MPNFLDLPLEIRLHVYRDLELPQQEPIPLGRHFAAEAAYRCPPFVLQISNQVSQEVRMAFFETSKRPWKIHVIASADAKLSLPLVLPDGLAQSAHVQFNFGFSHEFPPERDNVVTMANIEPEILNLIQSHERKINLFRAVRGINEICRRLAEVPVKRDLEIYWSDYDQVTDRENIKIVLEPFSKFRESCSLHLGKVLGSQDDSRKELADNLEIVSSHFPALTRSEELRKTSEDS